MWISRPEERVHGDGSGLEHRPDLVAVDEFDNACPAVADQAGNLLEGDPESDSNETKECRSSRGDHWAGRGLGR